MLWIIWYFIKFRDWIEPSTDNIYSKFFSLDIFNLKVSLNFWLLTTISIGSIRIISRDLIALSLKNDDELSQNFQNIAIFGTDSESIKLSDSPVKVERSPLLGEHTDEILREFCQMSEDEIKAVREAGAV